MSLTNIKCTHDLNEPVVPSNRSMLVPKGPRLGAYIRSHFFFNSSHTGYVWETMNEEE